MNSVRYPDAIGRHEVLGRLGSGNFASVFEAIDPALDTHVAIKVLADNHSADPGVRGRFIQEARLLRRLGSERLVEVYDISELHDGRPFIVMELAREGTLADRISSSGPAEPADVLRLIGELARCIETTSRNGVVHRDIKPSNLLIRGSRSPEDGTDSGLLGRAEMIVLADFGLAKDTSTDESRLTMGVGTTGYMAPEQLDPSNRIDCRADLYSATAVVLEVAAGAVPPAGGHTKATFDSATAKLSDPLREGLRLGLEPNPQQRVSTVEAWEATLTRAITGPQPSTSWTKSRLSVLGLSVLLVVTLAVGVAVLAPGSSEGPINGPTSVSVGETSVYGITVAEGAEYYWTDWDGNRFDTPALSITGDAPGPLTFTVTVTVDGEVTMHERSIRIVD